MSFNAEEDRQILKCWLGEKEGSEVLDDSTTIKFASTVGKSCDDEEQIRRGGTDLSEGHDDFYQKYFLASVIKRTDPVDDDNFEYRFIKTMKGTHQHPDIPFVSANGVVSVDLEAARRYFAEYFGVECEIAPKKHIAKFYSPFRLKFDSDFQDLFDQILKQQNSLTTFHHYHISLRDAFTLAKDEEETATKGAAAVGEMSCNTDALDLLALADPCEMQKAEFISKMQDDAELLEPHNNNGERIKMHYLGMVDALKKCDLQRILRCAGVLVESEDVFEELRGISKAFLEDLIRRASCFRAFSRRRLVTVNDVLASRPLESRLLGFGGPNGVRNVWSTMITRVLSLVHPNKMIGPKAMSVLNDINSNIMEELLHRAKDLVAKKPFFDTTPSLQEWKDEDGYDQRAFGFKVVNIGPDSKPDAFSTAMYTQEYQFDEDKFTRLTSPLPVISARDIQTAVQLYMTGELLKHAIVEGNKGVTRLGLDKLQGLGLPDTVALIASRMTRNFPMTEDATVFLAAVMEYITAELLELSGNADLGSDLISCRHLMLAIRGDMELDQMLCEERYVIREGGIVPAINRANIISQSRADSTENSSSFEKVMIAKAKEAATAANHKCAVFVDPRTGLHMMWVDDESQDEEFILHISELDKISQVLQQERRMIAEAALSESEIAMMKAEGYHIFAEDGEVNQTGKTRSRTCRNEGWAPEPLNKIHNRRLDEIRKEQASVDYFFPCRAIQCLVREVGQEFSTDLNYTQEAMEAAQAYLESYLLNLAKGAILLAIAAGRLMVQPKDLQLARRLRGEYSH